MTDHQTTLHRVDGGWVSICSCRRWRSDVVSKRTVAENRGEAHMARGDAHNRALAQFRRGRTSLRTELRWYEEQAQDPTNSEQERAMWAMLADEIRARAEPDNNEGQDQLW